jgi:hypothetical protein
MLLAVAGIAILASQWPPIRYEVLAYQVFHLRAYEVAEYKANWRFFIALGTEVFALGVWLGWRTLRCWRSA